MTPDDIPATPDYRPANDTRPLKSLGTIRRGTPEDDAAELGDGAADGAGDGAGATPDGSPDQSTDDQPTKLPLRLEVREIARLKDADMPALTGAWAWLLSHDDGKLISYSDGYESRLACLAAAKRVGWPMAIIE